MSAERFDPEVQSSVPFLGRFGTVAALSDSDVLAPGMRLEGLPSASTAKGAWLRRTTLSLHNIDMRFPADHYLIAPDMLMLTALAEATTKPVTVMLPADSTAEVEHHFRAVAGENVTVERLPRLPRPQGNLPLLLALGIYGPTSSRVDPETKFLMDLFSARVVGLTILIDPTDADSDEVTGWPSVWTPHFTGAYAPALSDPSLTLQES